MKMQSVQPNVRIHAVVLAIVLCMTLLFVAMTRTEEMAARLFCGLFGVIIGVVLVYAYRKEACLAYTHLIVSGAITDVARGRRGSLKIKYRFVALNGVEYRGESNWGSRRISVGEDVVIAYNPRDPTINQPLKGFLFYSFQPYGS